MPSTGPRRRQPLSGGSGIQCIPGLCSRSSQVVLGVFQYVSEKNKLLTNYPQQMMDDELPQPHMDSLEPKQQGCMPWATPARHPSRLSGARSSDLGWRTFGLSDSPRSLNRTREVTVRRSTHQAHLLMYPKDWEPLMDSNAFPVHEARKWTLFHGRVRFWLECCRNMLELRAPSRSFCR